MDAADLARWTRFAAKGGIGKCTAVQDCIAESPEDLMFLKDDEITVLMQLQGGAELYLGYCEGVVGRFQGAHVRFHGKLKRPVMTKRASTSAPSQRSASSSSTPIPSPLVGYASLRTDSPQLSDVATNEDAVQRRKTKERVSSVHSDPFDLELEPPPRRSTSLPRPGPNAGPVSRPGAAGTTDTSDYGEAESPRPQGFGDAGSDNDRTRRRTSNVRAGDELPGLEMFLPSARSRSSSRTRVNSALGTSSGSREDSSEPSSRPSSRGQDDEATSAKADRKRVRNLAVTQQLQLLQDQAAQSPHASSLDLPPSPLPHSQFAMYPQPSLHRQSPLPSPRLLPPPSPSLSSPAHSSHFSPSPPPPPSSGNSPRHPQSGGETDDKPSPRPLGADMQIRVDVDVIVRVSPSDMKPLAPIPGPPLISLPETDQLTSDSPQAQPTVPPGVDVNDQSQVVSKPLSESAYETQLVPADNEGDQEVSSLYDHSSVRSSMYSTQSFNSYASASPSLSNLGLGRDADELHAESDDNAPGFGIGLSMLQDMADEEEDDDGVEVTVVGNRINGVNGRMSDGEGEVPETPRFPAKSAALGSERPSTYSEGAGSSKEERARTHATDMAEGSTNESRAEGDREDEPEAEGEDLREDDSDYGDDDDDDYWDGADIYDNYRYSRYSVMTRASRRKSRYSVQSKYSLADFETPPPVPADARASPSPVPTFTSIRPGVPGSSLEERKRRVPAPLTLVKSNSVSPPVSSSPGLLSPTYNATAAAGHPLGSELSASRPTTLEYGLSPLLHTNFPSPQTSSSRVTSFGSNSGSGSGSAAGHDHGISLPSPSPGVIPSSSSDNIMAAGAASTLRQRLENDREADPMSPSVSMPPPAFAGAFTEHMDSQGRDSAGHGRGIVVEDDEGVSVTVVPADSGSISGKEHEVGEDGENGDKDGWERGKEPNIIRESLQSVASEASYATSTSVISDVSKEMRQIEADLAAATINSPTLANSSAGLHPPVDSLNEQRTPTAAGFSVGPTQPLRIDRTGIRAGPSPEQPTQPAMVPLMAIQQQPQQQPPVLQQQAPPVATHLRLQPPSQEKALFLPHPNAPRPNPAVLSGQRVSTYGMPPVHEPHFVSPPSSPIVPTHGSSQSLQTTLRMAAAARIGPAGVPHHATIFGKPIVDLASSDGPVVMVWSLQPFPPEPASRSGTPVSGRAPRRAATAGAAPSPLRQDVVVPVPESQRVDSPAPLSPTGTQTVMNGSRGPSVISRPNFSPQVGTHRPRSRSFSGFASDLPMKSDAKERASEEGSRPSRTASFQSLKDAATALVKGSFTSPAGHSARQSSVSVSNSGRGAHAPSPLSHPRNNTVLETPNAVSPLSRPPNLSEQTTPESSVSLDGAKVSGTSPPKTPNGRMFGLRQVASFGALKPERPESPLANPPPFFQPVRRNSGQTENASAGVSHPTTAPSAMGRLRRISSSSSSKKHQRTVSQLSRASSSSDIRSTTVSPPPLVSEGASSSASPPMQRSNSVKSKLSLSHLRIRNGSTKEALTEVQTPSPSTGPATPVFEFDNQPETVQVQDAEFEMIRPMMRRVSSEPTSDDSAQGRDERPSLQSDARAASPAASSLRSARSLIPGALTESLAEVLTPRGAKPAETESTLSVEAHRARELRWIAAMAAIPAAQARKSKKIRRLVLEGVPASVRYLVWAHLTDSKSRHMPGMYGVLGRRGRVAAADAIERDAVRCFTGQPHLQDAKGPLVNMLQTYFTMVPDIEYQTNLALIAGHLLLQSPEEDAFWTFVSIMDLHLRAYFSPKSVQMEADAMVFGKAVESVHPQLAKKLFVDMAIQPLELCRVWFSSLFTSSLPLDYANRIWDVYFCDGPPFLFRVGLALLSFCRSSLEAARDRSSAISILTRPDGLPTDPEALINAALATRLRDDDVRKQRTKVEAQLKRQTQTTHRAGSAPRLMSSISLPRAGV